MWAAIGGFTGLAIAGVVALSAALIGFLAYNSYKNSPEQQLKRISKASEEAKEGLEDAKKAYQDLQQNLSDLDNGIDAISEMTRGTVEWRNAINDSNDSLIKLLSTYGKLSSTNYTIDSDGLMHLKDGVKEELEQIAQDYVDTAQMASYAMQKMQYKAQQAVDDKEAEQVFPKTKMEDSWTIQALTAYAKGNYIKTQVLTEYGVNKHSKNIDKKELFCFLSIIKNWEDFSVIWLVVQPFILKLFQKKVPSSIILLYIYKEYPFLLSKQVPICLIQ